MKGAQIAHACLSQALSSRFQEAVLREPLSEAVWPQGWEAGENIETGL